MPFNFQCKNLVELEDISEEILRTYKDDRIFIFRGELGAGKTTLIKAICKQLHVIDQTNSPSFAIINEYNTSGKLKLYHFDFYRIKTLEEVFDIGYEEYFYSGNYCFIEWPELVEEILPKEYVEIKISWDINTNLRNIYVSKKTN